MIAVIGCGGAGGNIADEASKAGFATGAINFSKQDLDSLDNVPLKLRIPGSEGVGHDRDEAKRLLTKHYKMCVEWIIEHFSSPSIELIIFATSSGGGTGSSITPMLVELMKQMMPEKTYSVIVATPDLSEVDNIQANTLDTVGELSDLDISIIPVDNNQIKKYGSISTKSEVYSITNNTVINHLAKLHSYTERASKNGTFDKRDFKTTFRTKGILTFSEFDIFSTANNTFNVSADSVANRIHDIWEKSIYVPVPRDFVTRAAVIFDGKEDMLQHINHELIFSYFDQGAPIDLFEGFYSNNEANKIMTVLSGLPWINSRLSQIDNQIEKNKDKIQQIFSRENQFQAKSTNLFKKLRVANETEESKPSSKLSAMDILKKYQN
ncbi:hypothetical protein [Brevibacillus laterosporus]|uniref:hypothetical protein n=1 Tax=Brevibacillus laterosporus TaxID=1465 RepID=UPI001EF33763|nr:hypothetical protein [Brevibacillus laterosporus]MCG7317662.1 hypothetical protein [Brevibacillus laterosporus]